MNAPPIRIEVRDDHAKVKAMLDVLGYEVEIVASLPRAVDQRVEEMAAELKTDRDRSVLRAMLVTDNTQSAAQLLGLSIGTTHYHEQVVSIRFGLRRDHARLDLLRKITGIAPACTCEDAEDCLSHRDCRPGATG